MIAQSARSDWYTFLQIILLINLNLAVLNLLPLPALDGGRLVFVALAGIGLRVPEKREALVHAIGMVLLLSFIGLVTFTDVLALF
jgi:regulator of sigma E protease